MAMKMKSGMVIAAVAVAMMAMMALKMERADAAITCNTVRTDLQACIGYLISGAGKPPANCCSGVKTLAGAASTTADRRAACTCIKQAAAQIRGLKPAAASSLPGSCGVRLPYRIAPNTNCNTIV